MDVPSIIKNRRSIRKYKEQPVEKENLQELLDLAMRAPSGKNRQPWEFVVLQQEPKQELIDILHNKARKLKKEGEDVGSCLSSVRTMRQAPVLILIYNPYSDLERSKLDDYEWSVDTQSIGAAVENLLLAATDMGLGSLWICDVFLAEKEISRWLDRDDELVAAVALGHSAEDPSASSREDLEDNVTWLGEAAE